jgi:cell division cycle 2-like protein
MDSRQIEIVWIYTFLMRHGRLSCFALASAIYNSFGMGYNRIWACSAISLASCMIERHPITSSILSLYSNISSNKIMASLIFSVKLTHFNLIKDVITYKRTDSSITKRVKTAIIFTEYQNFFNIYQMEKSVIDIVDICNGIKPSLVHERVTRYLCWNIILLANDTNFRELFPNDFFVNIYNFVKYNNWNEVYCFPLNIKTMSRNIDINDIKQGKLIGSGSYGEVNLGTYKGKVVAIKNHKLTYDGAIETGVLNEIAIMQYLPQHDNILKFKGYNITNNKVIQVMELMDGDLNTLIHNFDHTTEWFTTVQIIMRQILRGLKHLNKYGIGHYDLKPANILYKNTPKGIIIKLADFGLSRKMYSHLDHICQTKNYSSPEVHFRRLHDIRADMWSVGCIFYELMTNNMLIDLNSDRDWEQRVVNSFGEFPEDYKCNTVVVKDANFKKNVPQMLNHGLNMYYSMMAYDPKNRIDPVKALDHCFFTIDYRKRYIINTNCGMLEIRKRN